MASWTFTIDAGGWSTGAMTWTNTDGYPAIGCLWQENANSSGTDKSGLSIPVAPGDPFSCWVKVVADSGDPGDVGITFTVKESGVWERSAIDLISYASIPFDSGWVQLTQTMVDTGTVDVAELVVLASEVGMIYDIYFDSVYIAESPPAAGYIHSSGGIPGLIKVST